MAAGRASGRQAPPALVATPRAKPLGLHGPHQADQITSLRLATTVVERPAPLLKTGTQSAPLSMAEPRVLTQTYWPPLPPEGGPIRPAPVASSGRRREPPLSCSPPETATPPGTLPTATE